MADDVFLKNARETAWTVYRARHPDVDADDGRRCLRMLTSMKMLVARVANGNTRPGWTLLAISSLVSATIVIGVRIAFGT